jgi:hypothetical protein
MSNRDSLKRIVVKAASARRIKIARHLVNIHQLTKELSLYNAEGLQKAAATGTGKTQRLKVAALALRLTQEKQAFAGAIGGLGRGVLAALRGMGGMASGLASGARPGLQTALSGAGQGVKDYILQHPLRATAGGIGAGLGGLAAAPAMLGAAGGALSGGYQGAKDTLNTVSKAVGGTGGDVMSRFSGAYRGFTDPKSIPNSSATASPRTVNPYLPRGYKALSGGY